MEPISFIIITTSGISAFSFAGDPEECCEILNIIGGKPVEWFDGSCHKKMLVYDGDLIAKINDFADKLGSKDNKQPFELRKFMKRHLQEGDPFYMFRCGFLIPPSEQIDYIQAIYQLQAKKFGKATNELWDLVKDDFKNLMQGYSVRTFGTEYLAVGSNSIDRVCRFCGRTISSGAKFNEVAHAISEALGNKNLICNEECDDCNGRLAHIEDSLSVAYLEIRRALCRIQGKKGVNSVSGQNFLLDSKTHQIVINSGVTVLEDENRVQVKLEGREVFTMENVYKALSKIVIDIMDAELLPHFRNTIEWINGNLDADEYPPIKQYYSNSIAHQPIIELYVRKKEEDISAGPYCFANLFVCDLILQFVVPFVDVDEGKFKTAKLISPFESIMGTSLKVYNMRSEYLDSGNKEQRTAWTVMEYDKAGIHPNSSSVNVSENLHMLSPKWDADSISFPSFNTSIIKSSVNRILEISNINDSISLSEEWLHDTSNNIRNAFVIDERSGKMLVDLEIEMCNTDNTQHLFTGRVAKLFEISDMDAVYNSNEDGGISFLKEFMIYLTVLSLSELNREVKRKVCSQIDLLKLDVISICDRYNVKFANL